MIKKKKLKINTISSSPELFTNNYDIKSTRLRIRNKERRERKRHLRLEE